MKTLLKLSSKLQKNTFKNFLILVAFQIIFSCESFASQKNSNLTFNEISSEGEKPDAV